MNTVELHETVDPTVVLIILARIKGHLKDASREGHNSLLIRLADMDADEPTLAAVGALMKLDGYDAFVDNYCYRVQPSYS